jgi:uncharacterized protein YjbJ (UPF0337 family)
MNWDIIKGKWGQFTGEARKEWGKLTDSDWEVIGGEKDKLAGKLQEHYGWGKDEAIKNIDNHIAAKHTQPEAVDPTHPVV